VISGRSGFSVWDIAMSSDSSSTNSTSSSSIVHRFRGGQAVDAPLLSSSTDTLLPVCEGSIIQGEEQLMFGCVSSGSSVLQVFKL
jgi:hypothetical protein